MIDLILDWLDGLLPGIVSYVRNKATVLQNTESVEYNKFRLTYLILQYIYFAISLFTLYYIYFIQEKEFFKVDIKIKAITTFVSILLLIKPTIHITRKLKEAKRKAKKSAKKV